MFFFWGEFIIWYSPKVSKSSFKKLVRVILNRCVLLPIFCRPIIADVYMSRNWSQQMVSHEQAVDPFWKGWKLFTLKYLKVSFEELESDTVGRNEKELLWLGCLQELWKKLVYIHVPPKSTPVDPFVTWLSPDYSYFHICQHCPPPPIINTRQDMNNRPQDPKGSATVQKKHLFIASSQFLEEKDCKFANSFRVIGYYPRRNLHIPWKPLSRWLDPNFPTFGGSHVDSVEGDTSYTSPGHHLHHDKKGQKQLEAIQAWELDLS